MLWRIAVPAVHAEDRPPACLWRGCHPPHIQNPSARRISPESGGTPNLHHSPCRPLHSSFPLPLPRFHLAAPCLLALYHRTVNQPGIEAQIKGIRQNIIRAASAAGEGHIASAFSILDILWVLYHDILRNDPQQPQDPQRDRFVLSKGHASLGIYGILAERGFFPLEELNSFASSSGRLGGHPDSRKVPGVEASTGSLGHGMPMAVGMALGLKIKTSTSRVVCIVGDGECNEGSVWEAALLAAHHQLGHFTCIVDYNHSGDRALMLGDLTAKFRSFGWDTTEVDGHDHAQLQAALTPHGGTVPRAIIASTIKGHGCTDMEHNPAWHHKAPKADELEALLAQLT
jgi:transketolase